MTPVSIGWQLTDLCDPAPIISLVDASSSEPDDAIGEGDGSTTGDIDGLEPGTADSEVLLRAERAANGPGRTYTLRYLVTDRAGNATPATCEVSVPHSQDDVPD